LILPAFRQFLSTPLVVLSGGAVTPASLIMGTALLLGSIVLARIVGASIRRLLESRGQPVGAQFAVAKMVRYAIIGVGTLTAISSMGIKLDAVLAASAVLLVGIGFGLQSIAQNFISGIILLIEQPVRKGDFVKVGDALGVVEDIGLRATSIITRDEVTIIVPNSGLISAPVVNHSQPTPDLRIRVEVGVAYGSDPNHVRDVLLAVAAADPQVMKDRAPEVRLEDFGESTLNFSLLVWISHPKEDLRVGSGLRFAIVEAFRSEKIEIPAPQREVRIKAS
jgi:potassium efflux system protein